MTCLAVSEVHSLIVSGSHDLTCILWDMEELSYVTQLAGHTSSISALAINELTVSLIISLIVYLPSCQNLFPLFLLFFVIFWLTVMWFPFIFHSMWKGGFSLLTACISSFVCVFCASPCVSVLTWASTPYYSVQG